MFARKFLITLSVLLLAQTVSAQECNLATLDPLALDKNQNGVINREEAQGTALTWVFNKVDSNGDGIISKPEFAKRCETTDTKVAAVKK